MEIKKYEGNDKLTVYNFDNTNYEDRMLANAVSNSINTAATTFFGIVEEVKKAECFVDSIVRISREYRASTAERFNIMKPYIDNANRVLEGLMCNLCALNSRGLSVEESELYGKTLEKISEQQQICLNLLDKLFS